LALQEAAQVDKLIEEETGGEDVLEDRLPLLGVPFTVKEAFSLQGRLLMLHLLMMVRIESLYFYETWYSGKQGHCPDLQQYCCLLYFNI
jgi:hypothetical protein